MISDSIKKRAARNAEEARTSHLVVGTAPKRPAPPREERKPEAKTDNKKLARSVLDELKDSLA